MIKNSKIYLFFLILSLCKTILASSSASFLVSQSAFNNYDFNKVLSEYNSTEINKFNNDYLDELISAVITQNMFLADKISNRILLIDPNNQEAQLLSMVKAFNNKNENKLKEIYSNNRNKNNDLFEFIFFLNDRIKTKKEISNSFLEIVRSSYSNQDTKYNQNYNFLLFYTSLSLLVDAENFEAIFIKGQLLQMINNFNFAEIAYQKIPEESDYFIKAQRNIAFIYSQENGVDDAEKKIKLILKKNKDDYDLKKILADFYRVKKKFEQAIEIYSDLIKQEPNDRWYNYYLRGICYEQSNNWEKAEVDFLKSLKIKRNSPDVLNYLAYGWIERDIKIHESFVMLTDAYNANPNSYYILDSLAWAYFKKKDFIKAAELMEKVIDMVPGEAISLDHLGDIYFAMNRKREAIYFWRQAKDLAMPEDKITQNIEKKLRKYDDI